MATDKTDTTDIIAQFARLFPKAFSTEPSQARPLAIGVKELLVEQCKLSPKSVSKALHRYTRSTAYLRATVEGAVRVNLDGEPAGVVTQGQAEHALRHLADVAKRPPPKPENAPTTKAAPNPPVPHRVPDATPAPRAPAAPGPAAPQNGPRRLGLADLRQAAAERRSKSLST
jgi:ProP effector